MAKAKGMAKRKLTRTRELEEIKASISKKGIEIESDANDSTDSGIVDSSPKDEIEDEIVGFKAKKHTSYKKINEINFDDIDFQSELEINFQDTDDKNLDDAVPVKVDLGELKLEVKEEPGSNEIDDKGEDSEVHMKSNVLRKDLTLTNNLPNPSFQAYELYDVLGIPDPMKHKFYYPTPFVRPVGHYLRISELLPDNKSSIEYDLDLEDKAWLELINNNVSLDDLPDDIPNLFEFIFDFLEKEWFEHSRKDPSRAAIHDKQPNPDEPCAICRETDCENSNAIVFCDGCDLAVHQDCYGVPYIPEGQWLCRKCMLSPAHPVECIFCPNEGGAFKQTTCNSWAHVTCTLWIPEVNFGNLVYMEPVESLDKIPKSRWKLQCYICKRKKGACIQCANKNCTTAFHVTCAFTANLYMKYKLTPEYLTMKAYCHKHIPKDYKMPLPIEEVSKMFKLKEREQKKKLKAENKELAEAANQPSKAAFAHDITLSTTGITIPDQVYVKLFKAISSFKVRKKTNFMYETCKYWNLKKEFYRSAPFIRRLHLEPWTAISNLMQTDEEKISTYGTLKLIRSDLERVRMLIELVRKREATKLRVNRIRHQLFENLFFPHTQHLRSITNKMSQLDTKLYFAEPVTKEEAPDYFEHIKHPMDLGTLRKLVDQHEVYDFDTFEEHLLRIYTNCTFYNTPKTVYHKVAQRHLKKAKELLHQVRATLQDTTALPDRTQLQLPCAIDELLSTKDVSS